MRCDTSRRSVRSCTQSKLRYYNRARRISTTAQVSTRQSFIVKTTYLPPTQSIYDVGGGNHPCVDVEGVGDPKAHKVPRAPLPSLWFDLENVSSYFEEFSSVDVTGLRSWLNSISCAVVRLGSDSTASLLLQCATLDPLSLSMAMVWKTQFRPLTAKKVVATVLMKLWHF
jgi:hypothetical protein